jgi:hypothetical protein
MKIVVNTENNDLLNAFIKVGKERDHQIIATKNDVTLFEHIEKCDVDAFVLYNDSLYFKKAVEFIKKKTPYIPIIGLMPLGVLTHNIPADLYMDVPKFNTQSGFNTLAVAAFHNIETYVNTFAKLQKLTAKMHDKIEFANCVYDPTVRTLFHNGNEVKKLSIKEGGILEILAVNYKEVVKKEVILEKVWRKTDYFVSRSMDVYITYLRNIFRDNNIKLNIKNISGIGLILE